MSSTAGTKGNLMVRHQVSREGRRLASLSNTRVESWRCEHCHQAHVNVWLHGTRVFAIGCAESIVHPRMVSLVIDAAIGGGYIERDTQLLRLATGGWNTVTTRRRINEACDLWLDDPGFGVWNEGGLLRLAGSRHPWRGSRGPETWAPGQRRPSREMVGGGDYWRGHTSSGVIALARSLHGLRPAGAWLHVWRRQGDPWSERAVGPCRFER